MALINCNDMDTKQLMPLGGAFQWSGGNAPEGCTRSGRMLSVEMYPDIFQLLIENNPHITKKIGKKEYFFLPDLGITTMIVGGDPIYTLIKIK